jgi:hypothetical protein
MTLENFIFEFFTLPTPLKKYIYHKTYLNKYITNRSDDAYQQDELIVGFKCFQKWRTLRF